MFQCYVARCIDTFGFSFLKHASEVGIFKRLTSECGGLLKEFDYDDRSHFEGVDDPRHFLTDQERQSIIKHMLFSVRAESDDHVDQINFLQGQLMCKYYGVWCLFIQHQCSVDMSTV